MAGSDGDLDAILATGFSMSVLGLSGELALVVYLFLDLCSL